jgi:hypothetical protein
VKKVGNKFRFVVTVPAGAKVVLYRNGKSIASGTKTTFMVPAGKAKTSTFHAVALVKGTFLITPKILVGVRATSTRK